MPPGAINFFQQQQKKKKLTAEKKKEGLIGKSTLYAVASAVLVSSLLNIFALQLSYKAHGKYFH